MYVHFPIQPSLYHPASFFLTLQTKLVLQLPHTLSSSRTALSAPSLLAKRTKPKLRKAPGLILTRTSKISPRPSTCAHSWVYLNSGGMGRWVD